MWIRERLSGRAVTERDACPPQSRGWQWPQPCAPPLPGAHIQTHPAKSKASQPCPPASAEGRDKLLGAQGRPPPSEATWHPRSPATCLCKSHEVCPVWMHVEEEKASGLVLRPTPGGTCSGARDLLLPGQERGGHWVQLRQSGRRGQPGALPLSDVLVTQPDPP